MPEVGIGAALARLQEEFPDLTISKLRFLEAEGLVTPQRRPSGYRLYHPQDLDRIRYILRAQRDRFWPLKVIAEALDALDRGLVEPQSPDARPVVPAILALDLPGDDTLHQPVEGLDLTSAELSQATGLDDAALALVQEFGLLAESNAGFDAHDVAVGRAVTELMAYGLEPRHLRLFRTAADREVALAQQVTAGIRGRTARQDAASDLAVACLTLHAALVRQGLARCD